MNEYDLLIVGGGLVGASLACALADTPIKIAVVEQYELNAINHASYDDRSVALSYGTRRLFECFNLWASIAPYAQAIQQIHVSEKSRFGSTRLDSSKENVSALGYVIENRLLGQVLTKRIMAADNITVVCPAKLEFLSVENEQSNSDFSVTAEVSVGEERKKIRARLLIAADGVQSRVRELLEIEVTRKDYGQNAIICNVSPELAHHGVAWERFTDTGPLAFLPLPDFSATNIESSSGAEPFSALSQAEPRCSVVWTVRSDQSEEVMALSDEEFLTRLQSRFGYRLGCLRKAGKRFSYPLALLQANKTMSNKVLLIGNASHTLHPVAGQGFNLGMRDVAVLAELLLSACHAGQDIADNDLLALYVKTRASDYQRIIRFTDNLVHWFSFSLKPIRIARSFGLVLTDRIPWLKSAIARQAMGLSQHMPLKQRKL